MTGKQEDLVELVGFVSASKYRKKVIVALTEAEKTGTQISDECGMYKSHVSKTVKELEEVGLVECLTPDRRKGKLFTLTEEGERVGSRLSISKEFSGLEFKIAKVLDHLSIPYARNVKLGSGIFEAAPSFVILEDLELKATVTAEALSSSFLKNLRESAFLVGGWKKGRESLKSMLVLGGTSKERALKIAESFVTGGSFDVAIHENDLECIREEELGLEEFLEVGKHCVDWPNKQEK